MVAIAVFAVAMPAHSEVMDKEPSAFSNWAWALLGGAIAIAAWRWRWWAGLMFAVLVLFRLYAVHLEIQDPYVGPAILNGIGVYVSIIRHGKQRRLTT